MIKIALLLLSAMVFLTGCDFNNAYAQIEDSELRRRAYRCVINQNPSTAEIQVCKNIRRECDRRRETGRFVC